MTRAPRWASALLRMLAPSEQVDDVLGDLEEAHRNRRRYRGGLAATVLTAVETVDMAVALVRARTVRARLARARHVRARIVRARLTRLRTNGGSRMALQDYKLGVRMLVKYPGLTLAGGLALALAIGTGAGWYDLTRDLFRPTIPLPDGDRIVEIEMRDAAAREDERRLLHDFLTWRRDVRSIEDLGAYRTLERNLVLGDARPEPVTVAEVTASAFRLTRVPPLLGRPLLDADERPGAPAVVILGYHVWQRRFGGRADVIDQTLQLGHGSTTVVGVMPEGFAFPVNHALWVPLQLRPSGYAPLEGAPIRVFGRVTPAATQAQANAELVTLNERAKAASPQTHKHLRPRVLAYGGESPGDRSFFQFTVTHVPILLVLVVGVHERGHARLRPHGDA